MQDNNHKRNLVILTIAQALGAASPPIIISLGGIIGRQLSINPIFATIPVSMYHIGIAINTIPAAILMKRLGRRSAYVFGCSFGIISGLIAALGVHYSLFYVFCLGTLIAGFYGAYVQSYRFAAADMSSSENRSKAIAWVMVGGLIAAIIGPQLVIWTRDAISSAPFVGSFLSQAMLALIALPFILGLTLSKSEENQQTQDEKTRTIRQLLSTPNYIIGVAAGVASYGLMAFLMTATPMAMLDHHHNINDAALGIQWHILAMYGPSFFTGRLITRYGTRLITSIGLIVLCCAALINLSGYEIYQFWTGLILLGIGWNFGFIGATTIVANSYRPHERAKAQGLNDFIVFGSVALASLFAGAFMEASGWFLINALIFPIVAIVLIPLLLFCRAE